MDFRMICQDDIRKGSNMVLRSIEIQLILDLIKKYQEENSGQSLDGLYRQLEHMGHEPSHGYDSFMKFMESAGSYKQGDYSFYYDYGTDRIAMEYLDGELTAKIHNIASRKELENYLEDKGLDNLRFCDACGAPMQSGYTDENSYFDTDLEFYYHMDQLYGEKRWRPEPTREQEWNYEYFDEEHETWRPSLFYWTEW